MAEVKKGKVEQTKEPNTDFPLTDIICQDLRDSIETKRKEREKRETKAAKRRAKLEARKTSPKYHSLIDDKYLNKLKAKTHLDNCGCDKSTFKPVCATDGLSYVNKCLLGCEMAKAKSNLSDKNAFKHYHNGACHYINEDSADSSTSPDEDDFNITEDEDD